MKRGGWPKLSFSPGVLTIGGIALGIVSAIVAFADLVPGGQRVVLVDTRPIQSVDPPFRYDNDQRRFVRLVVAPICPGGPDPLVAVGHSCTAGAEGVRVELRNGLVAGKAGKAVRAADLAVGLRSYLGGYEVTPTNNVLRIARREGQPIVPPALLLSWLRVQPSITVAPAGEPKPIGTGPFYVAELWCHEQHRGVHCSSTGGSPSIPLGDLEGVEDVLVLRRRDRSVNAATEIVVVGLRIEQRDDTQSSPPVLEPSSQARALALALDEARIHGIFDVEANLRAKLEKATEGRPRAWRFTEARRDRVLVAALHRPNSPRVEAHLPSRCRSRLVHALAKVRRDPTFLRHLGARPAAQLLPEPFEPVHTWQDPSGEPADESPDDRTCAIDLVTNRAWQHAAEEIASRIDELELGLKVNVEALSPVEEDKKRQRGDYGISLLSLVYQPRPAAYDLWDNLSSTGWTSPDHVKRAEDVAAREAAGEGSEAIYASIDELHRELDAYLIPMHAPTRVMAASDRLLGLEPSSVYLDPEGLRLAASASQSLIRFLLLAASALLFALAATAYFSRKVAARRERVELSLRMLRHDMVAPLATIKAYAERVSTGKSAMREALLSEAEAALAAAEDARFLLQEGKPPANGKASTRLREEVIKPILANLKQRSSYETAEEPHVSELTAEPPPLAVPPEVAKFVVRTLVENAWRHRGDRPLFLSLVGTIAVGSFYLEVEDHGPGMTPAEAKQVFKPGYRTDSARRDHAHGSGMGLHLARSILRLHGGEIELRQAANPTIFKVRFPLVPKDRDQPNRLGMTT